MPHTSSLSDQSAVRLQLRRTSTVVHPGLAQVFDVVDGPDGLVVVMAYLGDAHLLSQAGRLPSGGAWVMRPALALLHAHGRSHGAISASAVAVTIDGRVMLLPAPTKVAAEPAADLTALDTGIATCPEEPTSLVADPSNGGVVDTIVMPAAESRDRVCRAPRELTPTGAAPTTRAQSRSVVARGSLVLCGGFAGALVADVLLRLLG